MNGGDSTSTREARRFSNWLEVTLENMGLSGHEVAVATNVHDSAVSRWRKGTSAPSLEALTKLADLLGLDPLRMAVTAGQVPAQMAGCLPYPPPVPVARHESVKRQIEGIQGLDKAERTRLMEVYGEMERSV